MLLYLCTNYSSVLLDVFIHSLIYLFNQFFIYSRLFILNVNVLLFSKLLPWGGEFLESFGNLWSISGNTVLFKAV